MVQVILVLLYLIVNDGKPQVVLEKRVMKSMEQCEEEGPKLVEKIVEKPNFAMGLYAGCLPDTIVEAKK